MNKYKTFDLVGRDQELNKNEKLLYFNLVLYFNEDLGYAYPSYETIKLWLCVKRRNSVSEAIKGLEEKGYIKKETISGKTTRYYLLKHVSSNESVTSSSSNENVTSVKNVTSSSNESVTSSSNENVTQYINNKLNNNIINIESHKENEDELLKEKPKEKPKLLKVEEISSAYKKPHEKAVYYLNHLTGQSIKPHLSNTEILVEKLISQGYTLQDIWLVIEYTVSRYQNINPSILKPKSLFGDKFKSYLEEAKMQKTKMSNAAPKYIDKTRVLATFVSKTKPMRMAAKVGAGAYESDMVKKAGVKNGIELEKLLKEAQKSKGM